MRFQVMKNDGRRDQKDKRQDNSDGSVYRRKIDIAGIGYYEKEMADHKGDAPGGEPFDSFLYQKDIPKPRKKQRKDHRQNDPVGTETVVSQQC